MGVLIAWVLVRDEFRGKSLVNGLIDLPFALPTIVAGLTLLALYGNKSPVGINVAYTQAGVALALLFVTLPFVVRAVQPVLMSLDREAEQAAASLGAGPIYTFRRIVLPALRPAILAGVALAFGRAVGEFGAIVLSGNLPFKTEMASVFVFSASRARDHVRRRRERRADGDLCSCCSASPTGRAGGAHMTAGRLSRVVALGYLGLLLVVPVGMVFTAPWRTASARLGRRTTPPAQHAFYLTCMIALIAVPLNASSASPAPGCWPATSSAASGCSTRSSTCRSRSRRSWSASR